MLCDVVDRERVNSLLFESLAVNLTLAVIGKLLVFKFLELETILKGRGTQHWPWQLVAGLHFIYLLAMSYYNQELIHDVTFFRP